MSSNLTPSGSPGSVKEEPEGFYRDLDVCLNEYNTKRSVDREKFEKEICDEFKDQQNRIDELEEKVEKLEEKLEKSLNEKKCSCESPGSNGRYKCASCILTIVNQKVREKLNGFICLIPIFDTIFDMFGRARETFDGYVQALAEDQNPNNQPQM